jgi:hypothetical protein
MVQEIDARRSMVKWSPWHEGGNPNGKFPRAPKLFPAAPPPILIKRAEGRASKCYPTVENQSPDIEPGGWISVTWAQHSPAKTCAVCLKQASVVGQMRVPFASLPARSYVVGLCIGCHRAIRFKRWLFKVLSVLAILLVVWFLIFLPMFANRPAAPNKHGEPPWLIPVLIASIAALGAAIVCGFAIARLGVAELLGRPVKIEDGWHGNIRVLFWNKEFRKVFAREMGEQRMETIFQPPPAATEEGEEDVTQWAKRTQ